VGRATNTRAPASRREAAFHHGRQRSYYALDNDKIARSLASKNQSREIRRDNWLKKKEKSNEAVAENGKKEE